MENQKLDLIGYLLIILLFSLLSYAGYLSAKNIQWDVLEKLENTPLVLPTPATSSSTFKN
ncbi:hypothetical protein KJ909_03245 [Patescibacteria group bacterium]|nr:hypothetical protein [Patescibacteria group bacterium]